MGKQLKLFYAKLSQIVNKMLVLGQFELRKELGLDPLNTLSFIVIEEKNMDTRETLLKLIFRPIFLHKLIFDDVVVAS